MARTEQVRVPEAPAQEMTHRQVLQALSGLLLGLFVAILSSTIVSNALPRIIADLHGGQSAYTWVVTATLLAMTVSTPIWGKLADLFSKKLLLQIGIVVYVAGSALAGLSQNTGTLIACRVLQGIGVGAVSSLAMVIIAAMVPPRERGRYSGYFGAVFAIATVGGPLIGGVIVDTPWLGWRWCFYVGVPFAVLALVLLQRTLRLPVVRREVKIDYAGAALIAAGVSLLLIWVSLAGDSYAWWSWQTVVMIAGSLVLLAFAVRVERRASEPIIPPFLFRDRTIVLAIVASLAVGLSMMGASVFLGQYFQIARGKSPTISGLLTLPLIAGLVVVSTVVGRRITATGRWKRYLVAGGVSLTAGLALMGTARYDTDLRVLAVYMFLVGAGVGALQQNLILVVQNNVPMRQLGAASASVSFFRSLGGAVGVSVLGAVMGSRVAAYLADSGMAGGGGGGIPDVRHLPEPVRTAVESAFGHAAGDIFLVAAPFGLIALLCVLLIKETPLATGAAPVAPVTGQAPGTPAAKGGKALDEDNRGKDNRGEDNSRGEDNRGADDGGAKAGSEGGAGGEARTAQGPGAADVTGGRVPAAVAD